MLKLIMKNSSRGVVYVAPAAILAMEPVSGGTKVYLQPVSFTVEETVSDIFGMSPMVNYLAQHLTGA